jgi:hypothetical protein
MVLSPGGDTAVMPADAIGEIHNCGFWDRVSPKP